MVALGLAVHFYVLPSVIQVKNDIVSGVNSTITSTKEVVSPIPGFFSSITDFIWSKVSGLFSSWIFYSILLVVFFSAIILTGIKRKEAKEQVKVQKELEASKEYQKKLKRNEEVERLANTNFGEFSIEQLKEFLGRLKNAPSVDENLDKKIQDRISKIELLIPVQEQRQELKGMFEQKRELQKELDEISRQKHQKEIEIRGMEAMTLMELDADNTSVYLERDLSEKEVNLLLQHDFKRAVEYCVDEQRFVKVLVKRTMNHSITHTFLVWSTLKFLKRVPGITNLRDYDTREADIIFNHERFYRRPLAIEIETGNILNKKEKILAKVDDLNKKYKGRWIFLVSKKSLLGKYRKYGPAVCRSDFQKAIKNLLKPASPFEGI